MRNMNLLSAAILAAVLGCAGASMAASDPMVGGAAMYPNNNNIIQVNPKDHTTLVAAVKAGDWNQRCGSEW